MQKKKNFFSVRIHVHLKEAMMIVLNKLKKKLYDYESYIFQSILFTK